MLCDAIDRDCKELAHAFIITMQQGCTYSPVVHNQWTQLDTKQTLAGAGNLRAIFKFTDRHNLRVNRSLPFCLTPKCKPITGLHSQKMMKYEHLEHIHRL